jgi:hypothetical protein
MAYFDNLSLLLRILIFVAFILIFLYLAYCEGEKTTKTEGKGAGGVERQETH